MTRITQDQLDSAAEEVVKNWIESTAMYRDHGCTDASHLYNCIPRGGQSTKRFVEARIGHNGYRLMNMPPLEDPLDIEKIKKACPHGFYDYKGNYIPPDKMDEYLKETEFALQSSLRAAFERDRVGIEKKIRYGKADNLCRLHNDIGILWKIMPHEFKDCIGHQGKLAQVEKDIEDAIVEILMRNLSGEVLKQNLSGKMLYGGGEEIKIKDFLKDWFKEEG